MYVLVACFEMTSGLRASRVAGSTSGWREVEPSLEVTSSIFADREEVERGGKGEVSCGVELLLCSLYVIPDEMSS